MNSKPLTVAVVGATGVVGGTMIRMLRERRFPVGELRLLASARSAGRTVEIEGTEHTIIEATPDAFEGVDIALFSAGGDTSKALAPEAAKRGATVIDNSSAWRMDPDVPLEVVRVHLRDHEWDIGVHPPRRRVVDHGRATLGGQGRQGFRGVAAGAEQRDIDAFEGIGGRFSHNVLRSIDIDGPAGRARGCQQAQFPDRESALAEHPDHRAADDAGGADDRDGERFRVH